LWLCLGASAASGQSGPLKEGLTADQRRKLEQEARQLNELGVRHHQAGRLDEALKLVEKALQICRRLYPAERFPDGHPHLAASLENLGTLLQDRGDLAQAEPYLRDALAMCRKLYPPQRFPDGHPYLAASLENLGTLLHDRGELARAEPFLREALAMRRKLYPPERFPDGHPDLAQSLNNVGYLLHDRGELARAEPFYRDALAMRRKLCPPERFPDGHPELAASLNNLGSLLRDRGELARAEPFLREAVGMCRKVYPPQRFPDGHQGLAASLNSLGVLLQARGELARAESSYRDALAMRRKLYPPERFPDGHPELAESLNSLGVLLQARGELARAETFYREAMAMYHKLYPPKRFPEGHPHLAASLNNLGILLQARGKLARAEPFCRDALAMYRKLYPPERLPEGLPHLATSLGNLGGLLQARGELARAEPLLHDATAMQQTLLNILLTGSAETEALNYLARLPLTQDSYLSVTRDLPGRDGTAYATLWPGKGLLARGLARRRLAARATHDPETHKLAEQLTAARQELAALLLARTPGPRHAERLREASQHKEELEKQLARKLPALARELELARRAPKDLLAQLPEGTAFVDLFRYVRFTYDPKQPGKAGEQRTPSYAAFLLCRGQAIKRLELGPAADIEVAWAAWQRALTAGKPERRQAARLASLVWEPIRKQLPARLHTVCLAPEGLLCQVPWAALPGSKAGSFLLEEVALAVVPNGPALLDTLEAAPDKKQPGEALVLAVGGVKYDERPVAVAGEESAARAPAAGAKGLHWQYLPGTEQEVQALAALAGKRSLLCRRGAEASTAQILADLPKARYAHLATHGFFAGPEVRSLLQLSDKDYERARWGERIAPGARNPLVLSGLVLAGANLAAQNPEKDDGGILTAETIAGLNLDNLELAVLSACETGLGEVAGGEGVFGLQRAFHLAGAKAVVASLWKIDDDATQALMQEFYRNLWERKLPKLEALRRAQLAMLLHYDAKAGRLRAPGAAVPVDPAELAAAREKLRTAGRPPLPPLYWAGFVLSGDWR
jgi:CHAT domain-containing protein/tetratricopeptide (TPR) repeat protein